MKQRLLLLVCALFLYIGMNAQNKITVAVAANMQYAIEALKSAFNKQHKVQIDVVLGASGKLTQQIIAGAPFDIFISADTAFPAKVQAAGMAVAGPKTYAQGILVLWTARADIKPDIQLLTGNKISHIAIANPATAPYGTAAVNVMKKYKLYEKVAAKLVRGESITQASQYIASGNAEIGFTAKSIVIADAMKGKGHWVEIRQEDYAPIKQAAVLLKDNAAANEFYGFLFSAQAKRVFEEFGYIVR
ncbi:molybdate ABC transporter substrate-binding protein [Chitinophaga silvisoli]|uniref:Molybdate ABC transporter substrate-binding protein n=1 Tax=Chitinophaga silvisoli TaxID=2291814 RepID=A0A3E1P1L3_9BACT|nr:molybdate ABC transporter substrate-binding protein [Chitinophaga silvisoli]RFM34042.1 molybdate ABC transporter substrate-binding protein [Chitinophaga silvisoli]